MMIWRQLIQCILVIFLRTYAFETPKTGINIIRRRGGHNQVAAGSTATSKTEDDAFLPSLGQLTRFTVTAMPIFVAPTLLSLIDTAVVGRVSSLELAAMGPACAVVDSISGLLVFISVGTTNAISRSYTTPNDEEALHEARRKCTVSLILATAVGILSGAFLLLVGLRPDWFSTYAFSNVPLNQAQEMAKAAASYVAIRATAMPGATALMAAQAACLGAKDSKSPAVATALASIINVIGDIALVLGPFHLGIVGAAWATVMCQYAAFFTCVTALKRVRLFDLAAIWRVPPRLAEIKQLAFGGFLIVVLMKQVTYNQAVYLAALLGPAASAAHQVIYSLSRFCFSLGDVTGAAAQAFLPPILKQEKKK